MVNGAVLNEEAIHVPYLISAGHVAYAPSGFLLCFIHVPSDEAGGR